MPAESNNVMDAIVSLAKRRGFVYQASEIYGGIRGFWDYGPLGVLLKNNIRDWWWRSMVECPPIGPDGDPVDMVGIDSSIIQHPKTWKASGHVDTFTDPMVDDKESKHRFRADKVFTVGFYSQEQLNSSPQKELSEKFSQWLNKEITFDAYEAFRKPLMAEFPGAFTPAVQIGVEADGELGAFIAAYPELSKRQKKYLAWPELLEDFVLSNYGAEAAKSPEFFLPMTHAWWRAWGFKYNPNNLPILSPSTQKPTLTEPRPFNLMLDTYPGPIRDEENKAYLRPETAQGIFLNYKNILDTTRVKVPFGVAQVGKSFRNEVTPRNFIFRSREFEQMEMEFFCSPDDALKWYDFWKHERMKWWLSLGIKQENLIFRDHAKEELSHYRNATVDIEYKYPFTAPDFGELEGIAHRGCFDLTQHQTHSGQKLDYFDQELQLKLKAQGVPDDEVKKRSRYIPNVIEPASGLTRAVLVLLCEAYTVEARAGVEKFEYFRFKPQFAPIKAGIFPLVNKDGMPEIAQKLYMDLRRKFTCEYDPKQSIGKRYARMDEIGTPFSITIDTQTLSDQTVTVRERDSQQQVRVAISQVESFLRVKLA